MNTAGEVEFLDLPRSMALGVMEDMSYKIERFVLQPGEMIFMYTDGVTEAMNPKDEMFSGERLVDCLRSLKR